MGKAKCFKTDYFTVLVTPAPEKFVRLTIKSHVEHEEAAMAAASLCGLYKEDEVSDVLTIITCWGE